MKPATRRALALVLLALLASPVAAHYNMLLPEAASVQKDKPITLLYQWGHPFEHQLFDAPAPESLTVLAPDGRRTDLTKTLEKVTAATVEGKKAVAYRLSFTPEQRGDYIFLLKPPPIWMEEDQEFLQDAVKLVLHVQAQRGWDRDAGQEFEQVPLTRPYGLQPGMVFQVRTLVTGRPPAGTVSSPRVGWAGALVEVERYNAAAPKSLPPDEQITHTVKTDPNGVATCTLTEPGWWCLTAVRDGGKKEHNGKMVPVQQRSSLWVFVDGK